MTVPVSPATYGGVDGSGDRYPQLLRGPRHRWWRPLLGLLVAAAVVVLASVVVVLVLSAVEGSTPGGDTSLDADRPTGLLANNLVIATLVPAALLAVLAGHRVRPGTVLSVTGRLRWGLLGRCVLVVVPVVAVFFLASFLVPPAGLGQVDVPPAPTLVGLLAVVLLTTPLQSAAEEVGFRGYLSQAVASWFARPVTGTVVAGLVSATLFALAHGDQEPALFLDRFAFGAVASYLVWRTGGLEASIALHVVNNVVSLGWTASTGSVQESLETSSLGWSSAVLDVAMMLAYAALVARFVARRGTDVRRPARLEPPRGQHVALSGPPGVGYPRGRSSSPQPADEEPPWGMG